MTKQWLPRNHPRPDNLDMADLHVVDYGTGEPALLVHGSGSWGTDTFGRQRALADEFRLQLMDRRGYGQSPAASPIGWPTDAGDVADLLTELGGAHLVGHSSGGTVALLAAALAPDAVRSLVVVEPAVWGVADPASAPPGCAAADRDTWLRGPAISAREFLVALTGLYLGKDAAEVVAATTAGFTETDWAAADTWRHEAWPGDAVIDVTGLAAAPFPKMVVIGGYDPAADPVTARYAASAHLRALQAERRALARRMNARLLTFHHSAHTPMAEEPDTFNALLRGIWRATGPART